MAPRARRNLAPLCSNLRSLGSKCSVLKKVLVALLGLFSSPVAIRRPGSCAPLSLSLRPCALTLLPNRFRQIEKQQYDSRTDPCTVYVRIYIIITSMSLNPSIVMSAVKSINKIYLNLFFSSYLSTESRSMLPNISLVMEFLGIVFVNFIFEKRLSHEALVAGRVTATSNNQTQIFKKGSYKLKNLFERYRQLRLLPKQILFQSYFML